MYLYLFREDSERTPHKTIVDFTMTFKQNETTETVTHKLFDSVLKTKRLDEMPVLPHSLKVKGAYHMLFILYQKIIV